MIHEQLRISPFSMCNFAVIQAVIEIGFLEVEVGELLNLRSRVSVKGLVQSAERRLTLYIRSLRYIFMTCAALMFSVATKLAWRYSESSAPAVSLACLTSAFCKVYKSHRQRTDVSSQPARTHPHH